MPSTDDPSSSKSELQVPDKTPDSPRETSSTSSYRTAKQELQLHDQLEYLKQGIRNLRNSSLSRSIRIGKLKGAETRDEEVIEGLEKEIKLIREMVENDEKAVKELEKEIEKERKEKNDQLLRSLTDALPKVEGRGGGGAEMDEDGPAGSLSSVDTPAEEIGDFA